MQFDRLKRREFIRLIGGAALTSLAAPVAAHAQPGERVRRIGVLMGTAEDDPQNQPYLVGFKRALQELGWIEGRNIHVDYRFGASDVERMQRFAKELVNAQPDLIVGHTTRAPPRLHVRPRRFQLYLSLCPIRSAADSSRACRAPAAT